MVPVSWLQKKETETAEGQVFGRCFEVFLWFWYDFDLVLMRFGYGFDTILIRFWYDFDPVFIWFQ